MIRTFQTRTTRQECGNCFEACIASILEVPLEEVPDFGAMVLERRPNWSEIVLSADEHRTCLPWPAGVEAEYDKAMADWLTGLGLTYWEYDVPEQATREQILWMVRDGYWIASTQVNAKFRHATVWKGDELVHNPTYGWPVGERGVAVLGELKQATVFGALDPPRIARLLTYSAGEVEIRT